MASPSAHGPTALPTPPSRLRAVPDLGADRSLADVTERLMAEFGAHADVSAISRVVLDCRQDLAGAPAGAMPELLERLARELLLQIFPAQQEDVSS